MKKVYFFVLALFFSYFISLTAQNISIVKNITCSGDSDGELTFVQGTYSETDTYEWTNVSGTVVSTEITAKRLSAGKYALVVTGTNAGTYYFDFKAPSPIKIQNIDIQPNTYWGDKIGHISNTDGDCTGGFSAIISGGTVKAPENYYNVEVHDVLARTTSRSQISSTVAITNQPPGIYTIKVTDDKGCVATESITIPDNAKSPYAPMNIQDPVYVCYKETCSNNAVPSNTDSFGIYAFWDQGLYDCTQIDDTVSLDWYCGDKDASEFNTYADYYVVDTASVSGTKYAARFIEDAQVWVVPYSNNKDTLMALSPSVMGVYKDHSKYSPKLIKDFKSFTKADSISYHIGLVIDENTGDTLALDSVERRCILDYIPADDIALTGGKVMQTTSLTFTELRPGFHVSYFRTRDKKGCRYAWTVLAPENPVTINYDKTDLVCFGDKIGSITATAQGSWQDYDAPFKTLTIKGSGLTTPITVMNNNKISANRLLAGIYTITATDIKGCTRTQNVEIVQPEPLYISFDHVKDVTCPNSKDGVLEAYVSGGKDPYTYTWESNPSQNSPRLENLGVGKQYLTIKDVNKCVAKDSTEVKVSENGDCEEQDAECKKMIYNFITPNNDGKNDVFSLQDFYSCYGMDFNAAIFDQYGRKKADLNGSNLIWDPLTDGGNPNTGQNSTYTVFIKLLNPDGSTFAEIAESFSVIYEKN